MLEALISIIGSLALDRTLRGIDTLKAKGERVSSDDIIKVVKAATSEARAKGSETYNRLINRLNATPALLGMSPSLKSYLVSEKSKLSNEVMDAQRNLANVENKLNNIDERASNFASQDVTTRRLMKDVPNKLLGEVADITNQIESKV